MTVAPLVSVITPVFNGEDHVAEMVHSVRRQTFADFEHVVVDDGSTDATAAVVEALAAEDPRLRLVRQPNGGLSAARNAGWAASTPGSAFVLFIDHDDLLRPAALEVLVGALEAAPDACAAHGRVAGVDAAGNPVTLVRSAAAVRREVDRPQRWWTPRSAARPIADAQPTTLAALAYVLFIYSCGQVLIRRRTLDAVGGFDPTMRLAQDYDMWLRVSARGPLVFVPDVVLDYRQTATSMSSATRVTRREDLLCRLTAMTAPASDRAQRTLVRHLHRHHEWHRAADRLDLARSALRSRQPREVAMELVRAARSTSEAIAALVPSAAVLRARTAWVRRRVQP